MLFLRVNIFTKIYLGIELVYLTFFSKQTKAQRLHQDGTGFSWEGYQRKGFPQRRLF